MAEADALYRTPVSYVEALLPLLPPTVWRDLPALVWEPCAGDGAIIDAMIAAGSQAEFIASEIVPGRLLPRWEHARVTCHTRPFSDMGALCGLPDLVITNPPFDLAVDVAELALREVHPRGVVALLNRIGWAAGMKRHRRLFERRPPSLYPLAWRESFVPSGKVDLWDYAWFVWDLALPQPRVAWPPLPAGRGRRPRATEEAHRER